VLETLRKSMENEKIFERGILLKRAFPKVKLYQIGRELDIPYFKRISSGWQIKDED